MSACACLRVYVCVFACATYPRHGLCISHKACDGTTTPPTCACTKSVYVRVYVGKFMRVSATRPAMAPPPLQLVPVYMSGVCVCVYCYPIQLVPACMVYVGPHTHTHTHTRTHTDTHRHTQNKTRAAPACAYASASGVGCVSIRRLCVLMKVSTSDPHALINLFASSSTTGCACVV